MNEGKKDRRDPIRTIKPKNPVAKNANAAIGGGAAGAHKDKKRAEKNGETKHKKAEYAESLEHMLESALRDKADYTEKRKALDDLSKNKDVDQKAVQQRRLDLDKEAKKKGVAEEQKPAGWGEFPPKQEIKIIPQRKLKSGETHQDRNKYWQSQGQSPIYKANEAEFDSPEYNDEAGMARGNLLTLARAVKGLIDTIDNNDNLPEWCQEKIAKSEMMLVTVWDYLLSQKEQGIDPEVSEASINEIKKGQKDSNGNTKCWTGYHAAGTKKGKNGKPVRNCKPNEGWTHDSLGAELFETENTYEDKLENLLNKRLGR